jgi:hypothetical protein
MRIRIIKRFEVSPGRWLEPSPEIHEVWSDTALRAVTQGKAIAIGDPAGIETEKRVVSPVTETKIKKSKTNKNK